MTDAEICQQNGWTVGTVLEGDRDGDVRRIRIKSIGATAIVAVEERSGQESAWSLGHRAWRVVEPVSATPA